MTLKKTPLYSSTQPARQALCTEEQRFILTGGANEAGKKNSRHSFPHECMRAHVPWSLLQD